MDRGLKQLIGGIGRRISHKNAYHLRRIVQNSSQRMKSISLVLSARRSDKTVGIEEQQSFGLNRIVFQARKRIAPHLHMNIFFCSPSPEKRSFGVTKGRKNGKEKRNLSHTMRGSSISREIPNGEISGEDSHITMTPMRSPNRSNVNDYVDLDPCFS